MRISELIEKLKLIKKQFGDVDVECRNPAGDFDVVGEVFGWKRIRDDVVAFIGVEGEQDEEE